MKCLVFGGSGWLGSEVCRSLHSEGAKVVFTYFKNQSKAADLEKLLGTNSAIYADLSQYALVQEVVKEASKRLGGLDAIIQVAGVSGDDKHYENRTDRFQEIHEHDLDEILAANTKGTFALCQAAANFLKASHGGNIVIVGSMDGVKMIPSPVHFAASKSALKGIVESLAKELGKDNIKINLIAPGILAGGQADHLPEEIKKPYLEHCSLKRFGTAQEIATVISWFALRNTYVTGQSILLEGGL